MVPALVWGRKSGGAESGEKKRRLFERSEFLRFRRRFFFLLPFSFGRPKEKVKGDAPKEKVKGDALPNLRNREEPRTREILLQVAPDIPLRILLDSRILHRRIKVIKHRIENDVPATDSLETQ